ncbi:MAG: hypothetical protein IJ920_01625 [Paludibacteraceae bacterium]|nr:hypothetical protein [Paludibacteraceae bacterium]
MKFKQSIKTFALFLAALSTSVNNIWAQEPSGQSIYLAAFKAQTSSESTGAGTVKLTWVDAQGKLFNNYSVSWLNYNAEPFPMPYGTGNPSNNDSFESTAMVIGATMTATESVEDSDPKSLVNGALRNMLHQAGVDSSHIFMTPFAYFKADAQADDGSFYVGWTFNDARVWKQDTAMDKSALQSVYFKVLPSVDNVFYMAPPSSITGLDEAYSGAVSNPNNIYAVFNKYLLSNSVATSANIDAVEGNQALITVTVEVNGEAASLDEADFATFTFTNNESSEWSYDLAAALASKEVVSDQLTRVVIPVTYTYKNTGAGTKNSTMTIRMAGANPSSLAAALSVNALNPDRPAAYWFDGKTEQTSGTLAEMLATDISGYTNPILKLNKPVDNDLTFSGKNFTLDLNGNTAQSITVSSGNVMVAYSKYGGSASSLIADGGKVILNGGELGTLTIGPSGEVEQNGATITGSAINNGILTVNEGIFQTGLTSSKTLTVNNGVFNGTTAITISGGTAVINRGTIEGTTCGLKVTAGTTTVKKLAAIKGGTYSAQRTGGTLNIESGKFDGPLNGSINFTSGYFKVNNYGISTEGMTEMLVSAGVEYNEGYRYFLGTAEAAQVNNVGVCRIGTVSYAKLEDALAYANNNPSVENIVIFMTNDYILPAGNYTLPANATIVVPMSDTQAKEINKTAPRLVYNDVNNVESNCYANNPLVEFRRLTFASGVNMDVFGDIEMTGTQYSTNEAYTSQPVGAYGRLVMEEGSHMTLQNGSELRAWGFMTGKGETDARRGAIVREMFQMGDWKGAMTSVKITGMVPSDFPIQIGDDSDKKIFPVTQYFIQNVESPVKYHPGALLSTSAAVSEGIQILGSVSMTATDIAIVGVSGVHTAIFLMDNEADAENTWVRKWYDPVNDVQVYDVNSGAHIGSMELDLGTISLMGYTLPVRLNSAKFDLPLTSNFKIHLLSGSMDFMQNTCLLPGAEVEVDKESVVSVTQDNEDPEHTGALYVYDAADWDKYAYCNEYNGSTLVKGTAYTKVVRYAPSWNGRPTVRKEQVCPLSAAINVHGRFETGSGFVYTSEHGANIFSTNEDAGTFLFDASAESADTPTVWQVQGVGTYVDRTFYPAKLKNGVLDPAFANTADAEEGDAYCYTDNKWNIMKVDEDNSCFMIDNYGVSYAKPAEYVALANGKTCNADHTYSDADGAGRLFILTSGCQWWEVEKKDNLYHCIHPNNDTYYYWDDVEEDWKEQRFTITWKNWDGNEILFVDPEDPTIVIPYSVTYGTMAEFLGTNPTREQDIDYTYDFTGWSPELGPVTSDVTYTATYEKKERKYTITFLQEGGVEIERQFLPHNAVPVCENTPTKVGHILQWDPAISPVIKDQTYTATWLEELPDRWWVTFVNNNGEELQKTEVLITENPSYAGIPTKKNADGSDYSSYEYTCNFNGWDAVIDGVAQHFDPDETLPCPTAPTTYTATYTQEATTYNICFYQEDGTTKIGETQVLHYGDMPVAPTGITKQDPEEGYSYTYVWQNKADDSKTIETVKANADYKPVFSGTPNKYTVTLISSIPGAATFTGAGIYEYGKKATVKLTANSPYTFIKWDDESDESTKLERSIEVKDDITLTAIMQTTAKDTTVGLGETFDGAGQTVKNLILKSNTSQSGEITGASSLKIDGQAYFDLTLNAAAQTWYAFAVPWKVDATSGVSVLNGAKLELDRTYHVLYYDGANRAAHGKAQASWKFLADKADKTLEPGVFYLIYLNNSAITLRFTKKAGASINTISVMVQQYPSQTGNDADANWNGIANPAVYRAFMNAGVEYGQKYESSKPTIVMSSHEFIVGEPIFVQVPAKKTVIAVDGSYPASAPSRWLVNSAEEPHQSFDIRIAAKDADYSDRLFVKTATDKADKYIIGQDLAKISVSKKAAQFWVDRYDAQLCVNTQAVDNDQAFFPLGIFAPTNGQYTISSATALANNEELFVTIDGTPVWNLGAGAYTIDLAAGNTTEYGLMVVYHPAPEVTTGCENIEANNNASVRKVLINGQVFILRDGAVYTIFGQKAK